MPTAIGILIAIAAVVAVVYFAFLKKPAAPTSTPVVPTPKPPQNLP